MQDKTNQPDFTDAELAAFGRFCDELRDKGSADIESYLAQMPGAEDRLRPLLETAARLYADVERFRRDHPDTDLGRLLDGLRPGRD